MRDLDFINRKLELSSMSTFGGSIAERHKIMVLCSPTGVGKSALVRRYLSKQAERLGVKTSIMRTDRFDNVSYLNQIAKQIDLWAGQEKKFRRLDEFLRAGLKGSVKKDFVAKTLEGAAAAIPGGGALSPTIRKVFSSGEYDADQIIYGVQYSASYPMIKYITEFFNEGNAVLSIDNVQNIDEQSISYLANIIRESRPGCWIFEYTDGVGGIELGELLGWAEALGCDFSVVEVEALPWSEVGHALKISDDALGALVQRQYKQSKGNLKDFLSARYLSEKQNSAPDGDSSATVQLLLQQNANNLMVVSLIATHDGPVSEAFLLEALKRFPTLQALTNIKPVYAVVSELAEARILVREAGLVRVDHDSVVRIVLENRAFEKYRLLAFKAWLSLYKELRDKGDFFVSEVEIANSIIFYSFKVGDDAELWSSLHILADRSLKALAPKNVERYVGALYRRISRPDGAANARLHKLTSELLRLLYKLGAFEAAIRLLPMLDPKSEVAVFYNAALLAELDQPVEAFDKITDALKEYRHYSAGNLWKAIKLLEIAALRMANKPGSAATLYAELRENSTYVNTAMEPYFELLAGVALPASAALEPVRTSVAMFKSARLSYEADCGRITLSQLLGDVGLFSEARAVLDQLDMSDGSRNPAAELNNRVALDIKTGQVDASQQRQLSDAALFAEDDFSLLIIYTNVLTVSTLCDDLARAFEAAGIIRGLLDAEKPAEHEIRRIASFNLAWFYGLQGLISEATAMGALSRSIPSEVNSALWDYRFGKTSTVPHEYHSRLALDFEVPMFAYWQLDVSIHLES